MITLYFNLSITVFQCFILWISCFKNKNGIILLSISKLNIWNLPSKFGISPEYISINIFINSQSEALKLDIFLLYFILKCIFVYTKGRKEEAENLSDIKEIVKKEEMNK